MHVIKHKLLIFKHKQYLSPPTPFHPNAQPAAVCPAGGAPMASPAWQSPPLTQGTAKLACHTSAAAGQQEAEVGGASTPSLAAGGRSKHIAGTPRARTHV